MPKNKKKPYYHKFADNIAKLFRDMGAEILNINYYKDGADVVIRIQKKKILIQCKISKNKNSSFHGLADLIRAYSDRTKDEKAKVAILAIKNYHIPEKYLKDKERLLKKKKVVIWDTSEIKYYTQMVSTLGKFSVYPILRDLGFRNKIEKDITVKAFKIYQNNREFCLFTIRPEILLKIADVYRRVHSTKGYQRMVDKKRLFGEAGLKEFLENKTGLPSVFPNALVCYFKDGAKYNKGKLTFPIKYGSVWIIDGQHRLYGFCDVSDDIKNNFDLICSAFNVKGIKNSDLDLSDQGKVFRTLNEKAKKVPRELLIEISLQTGMADREVRVVDLLRKIKIFKGKIKSVDTSGDIHITTFVDTPPMKSLVGSDKRTGILSKYFGRSKQEKIIKFEEEEEFIKFCSKILERFFVMIDENEKLGKKWKDSKNYILSTDRGVRGLLRIFPFILNYTNGLKEKSKVNSCLDALEDFDFSSESLKKQYLGEGGADNLRDDLVAEIQNYIPEFGEKPEAKLIEIEAGNYVNAKEKIKEIFEDFSGEIIGELPFIDKTTFSYLSHIPKECIIKLFIHGSQDREKDHNAAIEFSKLRRIEIKELRKSDGKPYVHQRWLSDGKHFIEFPNDLKESSLASRKGTIQIFDRPRLFPQYQRFREEWALKQEELEKRSLKREWFLREE